MLAGSEGASLAEALLQRWPFLASVAPKEGDAGLIQRLDFETSGLIIGAKNAESWQRLNAALKTGQIKKSYLALLRGQLRRPATIKGYIGAHSRSAKKVRVYKSDPGSRALAAESSFRPVRIWPKEDVTLARAQAPTARRHQIRAHAAALGHPLVGDSVYGDKGGLADCGVIFTQALRPGQKFLLHAETVEFEHPVTGERLRFDSSSELIQAEINAGRLPFSSRPGFTSRERRLYPFTWFSQPPAC